MQVDLIIGVLCAPADPPAVIPTAPLAVIPTAPFAVIPTEVEGSGYEQTVYTESGRMSRRSPPRARSKGLDMTSVIS